MSDHPIKEILTCFDQTYTHHCGTRYPLNRGKDTRLVKDLLAIYSEAQLREFIAAFFEMDDEFFAEAGHSLGVFRACLPKVIAHLRRKDSLPSVPKNLRGIANWVRRPAANE